MAKIMENEKAVQAMQEGAQEEAKAAIPSHHAPDLSDDSQVSGG